MTCKSRFSFNIKTFPNAVLSLVGLFLLPPSLIKIKYSFSSTENSLCFPIGELKLAL